MQFKSSVAFVFTALAAVASAASNAFSYPLGGETFAVNQTISITWANPAGSSVTLSLLSGSSTHLTTVQVIGSGVPNQGIVAWSIPDGLVTGLYALSIADDENGELNYSGQFTITGAPNVTTTSSSSSSSSSISSTSSSSVLSTTAYNTTLAPNTTTSSTLVPSSVTNTSSVTSSAPFSVLGSATSSASSSASGSASSSRASRASSAAATSSTSNAAVPVKIGTNVLGALALALL